MLAFSFEILKIKYTYTCSLLDLGGYNLAASSGAPIPAVFFCERDLVWYWRKMSQSEMEYRGPQGTATGYGVVVP